MTTEALRARDAVRGLNDGLIGGEIARSGWPPRNYGSCRSTRTRTI